MYLPRDQNVPGKIGETSRFGYAHGKPAQRSFKGQVAWLHIFFSLAWPPYDVKPAKLPEIAENRELPLQRSPDWKRMWKWMKWEDIVVRSILHLSFHFCDELLMFWPRNSFPGSLAVLWRDVRSHVALTNWFCRVPQSQRSIVLMCSLHKTFKV